MTYTKYWTKEKRITYEDLIILEARIEIATNLLQAGLEVEFVSSMTGLSVEAVEELPKYNQNDRY